MISVISYKRPQTLAEALSLMRSGEFAPIAGGTDLVPQMRHSQPRQLMDISRIGIDFINSEIDAVEIGAAATHTRLNSDNSIKEFLPLLSRASGLVGSWQIRNRGTVGGNIVNASPCADTVPALLIYDAKVVLVSSKKKRMISLAEFILKPYLTDIKPNELLHSIICRKSDQPAGASYLKLGRRQAVNISRMTLAVSLVKDENDIIKSAQIAVGSVFPVPSRVTELENMLVGQTITSALFNDAANLAADLMIRESGLRWSTSYKKPVLIGLMGRALNEAAGIKGIRQ